MKKISILFIAIIICCFFSGCNINISSIDTLMRPPKLSGENSLLQQTFESTVGDSESIVMKTPVSGDNRSSYLLYDLDNDSVKEALVLYSDPIKDDLTYITVFKYINEKWLFVSTIKGRSSEIYSVDFADINGDGNFEILISWSQVVSGDTFTPASMNSNGEKLLTIYSYNGGSVTLLKNEAYSKLLVADINNDSADELFILTISLTNQEKVTLGRIVAFDKEYSIEQELKFQLTGMLDVHNIVCDSYSIDEEFHTRVYVDGSISESGIITEIIDIKQSDFSISLPFYESNISSQPLTLRDVRVYSQDIDNDGVVEVPVIEKLPGGIKLSITDDEKSVLNLTVWSEVQENQMTVDSRCLLNGTYGYMFLYPEDWLGNITAVYNEKNATVTFYSLDDNETLISSLFSIKSAFKLDWEEENDEYTKFDENGVYVYGYSIVDDNNEDLYISTIEDNFILLNQE